MKQQYELHNTLFQLEVIKQKTLSSLLTHFYWFQYNFCKHSQKSCSHMHACHVNKNFEKSERNCSSFLVVIHCSLNFKFWPTQFWKMYKGYQLTPLNSERIKINKFNNLFHQSYKLNFLFKKSNLPHQDSEGLVHLLRDYLHSTLSANKRFQSNIFMLKYFFASTPCSFENYFGQTKPTKLWTT